MTGDGPGKNGFAAFCGSGPAGKSYGERLKKCGTGQINREMAQGLSQDLREALEPLFGEIESLNERIAEYDRRIEQIAKEVYPQVALLRQVKGIGTLIALRPTF